MKHLRNSTDSGSLLESETNKFANMDISSLSAALVNPQLSAAEYLKQFLGCAEFSRALVTLSFEAHTPELQLAAAIYLKNTAECHVPVLTQVLLRGLSLGVNNKVRQQYEVIARRLVSMGSVWTELESQLDPSLQSTDTAYAGVCLIYQIAKVYPEAHESLKQRLPFILQCIDGSPELLQQVLKVCSVLRPLDVAILERVCSVIRHSDLHCRRQALQTTLKLWESNIASVAASSFLEAISREVYSEQDPLCLILMLQCLAKATQTTTVDCPIDFQLIPRILLPHIAIDNTELFHSNPVEFIRQLHDPNEFSVQGAALQVLQALCACGGLPTFVECMKEGVIQGQITPFLLPLGNLASQLKRSATQTEELVKFIELYVSPCLNSNSALVRAHTCWVYAQYADVPGFTLIHKETVLGQVCKLLLDSCIVCRYEAATTLSCIIEWNKPRVQSELAQLLKIYLQLLCQVQLPGLVQAFSQLVRLFEDEIQSYAVELCRELAKSFYTATDVQAARSFLSAMTWVVEALDYAPALVYTVSFDICPVLEHALSIQFDESLSLLAFLLYECKTLPHAFSLLQCIQKHLSIDNLRSSAESLCEVLGNLVQNHPSTACEQLKIFLEIADIVHTLRNPAVSFRILIILIENLHGALDSHVPAILMRACEALNDNVHATQVGALHLLLVLLWHNAELAVQSIAQTSATFCRCVQELTSAISVRYAVCGLLALVQQGTGLPLPLQTQLPWLFSLLLKYSAFLVEAVNTSTNSDQSCVCAEPLERYDSPVEQLDHCLLIQKGLLQLAQTELELFKQLVTGLPSCEQGFLSMLLEGITE